MSSFSFSINHAFKVNCTHLYSSYLSSSIWPTLTCQNPISNTVKAQQLVSSYRGSTIQQHWPHREWENDLQQTCLCSEHLRGKSQNMLSFSFCLRCAYSISKGTDKRNHFSEMWCNGDATESLGERCPLSWVLKDDGGGWTHSWQGDLGEIGSL